MKIIFHDTETTGVDLEDRILQSAYSIYELKDGKLNFIEYMEENILPPVAINPAAAAIHGIWYPDLKDAPTFEDSKTKKDFEKFIKKGYYYCAHNSPFDLGMMAKEGIEFEPDLVIDTLKIARHINIDNEDIKSNGLQYLRYYYNFDMEDNFIDFLKDYKIKKLIPHTALSDIAVLAYYFKMLVESNMINGFEDGVKYTLTPVPEKNIKFGNVYEKGTAFYDVATTTYEQYGKTKRGISYLNWAIGNMDTLSADVKIGLSKAVVQAIRDDKLSLGDRDVTPMLSIAATFDKESRDYLFSKGYSSKIPEKTMLKITQKIKQIEMDGLVNESKEYKELLILVKYYNYMRG